MTKKVRLTAAQKKWLKDMPVECADFSSTYKPCHKLAELGLVTEKPIKPSFGRVRFERTPAGEAWLQDG